MALNPVLLMQLVKYLMNTGIVGDPAELKGKAIQFLKDNIDPWWLEAAALVALDAAWDIILGKVDAKLAEVGTIPFEAQHLHTHVSQVTADILKAA